jgi:hypothetical protein
MYSYTSWRIWRFALTFGLKASQGYGEFIHECVDYTKKKRKPTQYHKVKQMSSRIKIFAIIAVLGFIAGIIAQATAQYFIPWFISVLPLLGGATSFIISGCAGAVLTVAIVSVWAYMTGKKDPY